MRAASWPTAGSPASIAIDTGITFMAPGSVEGLRNGWAVQQITPRTAPAG
ncbi:hypothetical protein [Georgenia sp. AZ-5]